MYIDFDDYLPYSGRTFCNCRKRNLMKVFNVIMVMLILQAKKKYMVY